MRIPGTFKPSEVAKLFETSTRHIQELLATGELGSVNVGRGKINKRYLVYQEHIDAYRKKMLDQSRVANQIAEALTVPFDGSAQRKTRIRAYV